MAWVRLDDAWDENPKVLAAGPLAAYLYVAGLCYSNRRLTDGFIPKAVVPKLAILEGVGEDDGTNTADDGYRIACHRVTVWDCVARLEEQGLWERVEGGWQVHDFLDYQRPSSEVRAERETVSAKRAEAGRKGAFARWQNKGDSPPKDGNDGNSVATVQQTDDPNPNPNPNPNPSARTSSRDPDPLFEAVANACGITWREGLTDKARKSLDTAVAELRKVNAQPSDVTARARRLAERWGPEKLTPHSLAKHWPSLNGARAGPDHRPTCRWCNAYLGPTHAEDSCHLRPEEPA